MGDLRDLQNTIKRQAAFFNQKVKGSVPIQIGNKGTRMWMNNFNTESFFGEKWPEVKRRESGEPAYKYARPLSNRNKKILDLTGRLRRGVNNSLESANWERIKWRVSVPYGGFHNYGINGRLPMRKFMGSNKAVNDMIDQEVKKAVSKVFEVR